MVCMLGKIACGLLVPNFSATKRFKKTHLRDCLVLGFSMAAEGEFAFVIAVFAVSNKLIGTDLYAALVLAVLVTTIVSPFGLSRTIAYFNKKAETQVFGRGRDPDADLEQSIKNRSIVFYCIQTKSAPAWGLQTSIVETLNRLNLDVIDHRAWHPRQSDDILVNEMYVKDDDMPSSQGESDRSSRRSVEERIEEIRNALSMNIHQREAIVRVQQWHPQIAGRSPEKSVTAHVVDETARALRESMVKWEQHSDKKLSTKQLSQLSQFSSCKDMAEQPSSGASVTSQTSGSDEEEFTLATTPNNRISHLDSRFEGRLDGMFRHDGVDVTDEYEVVLEESDDGAYAGRAGISADEPFTNWVMSFLVGSPGSRRNLNNAGTSGRSLNRGDGQAYQV